MLFDELTALITGRWPELNPETMPMPTPQYVVLLRSTLTLQLV